MQTWSHVSDNMQTWSHVSENMETWSHVSDNMQTWSHVSDNMQTWNQIHVSDNMQTWSHVSDNMQTWSQRHFIQIRCGDTQRHMETQGDMGTLHSETQRHPYKICSEIKTDIYDAISSLALIGPIS